VQDHPYNPDHLDALSLLVVILGQTPRVRVFPTVTNLGMRPPAMLAKAAARGRVGQRSRRKEMNSMESLAFSFPLKAGKTEEWRAWIAEILGPRRSQYEAFSRRVGLGTQRAYLQHTPHGDQAIIYLEGNDLQRVFQHLQIAQDPYTVWLRQRTQDLFDGVDLAQISPGSLSQYVFEGPSAQKDEASYQDWKRMERLGMISP
jgi:hypothetical protein